MRIAFDAKRYFHNQRGLGNYSRDVVRLMATYAPDNEYILCGQPNPAHPLTLSPNTHILSPHGIDTLWPGLWRSRRIIHDLKDIDIYHGLSGELPIGIPSNGAKTIVTVHDAIFVRYPELYSPTYRRLFRAKVEYACDKADVIIAISEQTKRDCMDYFHADENKIHVLYQGCSSLFRQSLNDEQIAIVQTRYALPDAYLLDVGAIELRKNLKNLILAIDASHISLPLVVIGGYTRYAEEAITLANRLGVHLILRHGIPIADLPAIYKGAVALCYPSIFEGFGIPIVEAMCVGTPVLTSTGSCFAETGGDAALYADPMNPEDIGDKLKCIIENPSLRQTMIAKGYQQAALFSDEVVANNMIQLYTTLMK